MAQPPAPYPTIGDHPSAPTAPRGWMRRVGAKKLIAIVGGSLVGLCVLCGVVVNAVGGDKSDSTSNARPAGAGQVATSTAPSTVGPPVAVDASAPTPTAAAPAPETSTVTTPASKPTSTKPVPGTDPRFATCRAAKEHGYGPYVKGKDPEYYWYDDRDLDGIVCE